MVPAPVNQRGAQGWVCGLVALAMGLTALAAPGRVAALSGPELADKFRRAPTSPPDGPALEFLATHAADTADGGRWSPAEIFRALDIGDPDECRAFDSPEALLDHKDRWRLAIEVLADTHPKFVDDWLSGQRRPPRAARREATFQRNCLVDAMFRRAETHPDELTLDLPMDNGWLDSKEQRRVWVHRYNRNAWARHRLRRIVTLSHHRSAVAQASIWRQKFHFHGSSFHKISSRITSSCALPAGGLWDPTDPAHRTCWNDELDDAQRGREILQASSAPGISRHHWGSEFDFFSLATTPFEQGRLTDEFRWLRHNALHSGFFQPYQNDSDRPGYMAEPWHWSYFPIGRALTEFAAHHPDRFEAKLDELWSEFATKFRAQTSRKLDYFDYIRDHWRLYVFGLSSPRTEGMEPGTDSDPGSSS